MISIRLANEFDALVISGFQIQMAKETESIDLDKDIVDLGKKSSAPVARLFDACRKLNGMTDEDVAEIEGN